MSGAQRMRLPRPAPTRLVRRIDSTTPTEPPTRDSEVPASTRVRPAYLAPIDHTLAASARQTAAPLTPTVPLTPAAAGVAGAVAAAGPAGGPEARSDAAPGKGDAGRAAAAAGAAAAEGAPAGAAGGGGEGPAGARQGAAGAAAGAAVAPGRGAGRVAGGAGGGLTEDEAAAGVPLPETGLVPLPTRSLTLPPASAPFDAPRRFDLPPLQPVKERTPDLDRYATMFEAAIETAARFAARLVEDAARDAAMAESAESQRAALRQRALDRVLLTLDGALEQARADVAAATHEALALVDRRARAARMRIGGAARRAHDSLTAEVTKIRGDTLTRRLAGSGIQLGAGLRLANITAKGNAAADALNALSQHPALAWPLDGSPPIVPAQNEAIDARVPPRATNQAGVTTRAAAGLVVHLQPAITNLGTAITNAFAPFEAMVTALNGPAKQAVDRARDNALKHVRDTQKALRDGIEQGRTAAEAGLVQQHDAVRRQLLNAARTRAEQERTAAERGVAGRITTATGLARSQGAAVRAVLAGLEPQRRRPAADYASIVVRAAQTTQQRMSEAEASQRPKLNRSTPQAMAALDSASATTSARMNDAAENTGDKLRDTAQATGEAFQKQADEGTESFATVARPVSQSIASYVEPIRKTYADNLLDLDDGLEDARNQLDDAFAGRPVRASRTRRLARAPPPAPAAAPPSATTAEGPTETADHFVERTSGIAADATREDEIKAFAEHARSVVSADIRSRANAVSEGLKGFWGPDVERVMSGLRGMSVLRANALKDYYLNVRPRRDIVQAVRFGLQGGFHWPKTIRKNIEAAMGYLAGNPEAGALAEMEAAANMWNDEARVERVQRSLTPAQMTALANMPGAAEILDDIQEDLGGKDAEVMAALREATPESIGRANAIRLEQGIDRARETRGIRGSDTTVDAIVEANRSVGTDRLSGADEFAGLEPDGAAEARRQAMWQQTVAGFAARHPLAPDAPGPRDAAAALTAYATAARRYEVFVPDPSPDYGIEDRRGGVPRGHTEVRYEGITGNQARLIDNVVRFGHDSAQARGARMAAEMDRPGGRPDLTRLALATADDALNPGLSGTSPAAERRRADALRRNDDALLYYWQYTQPAGTTGPPPPPAAIRAALQADMAGRFSGDPDAAAQANALTRDPRAATDEDYARAAVAGFNYALSRPDPDKEVLSRTFHGLSFEQAELANRLWNEQHPGGPTLYARLGIHGEGNYWRSLVTGGPREAIFDGDDALQLERDSLGTPTNDAQRFMLAALSARQQIRESGFLGRVLASEEYGYLRDDYANLLRIGNVSEADFDRTGRLRLRDPRTGQPVRVGRFDEQGRFVPPEPGSTEEFEAAMDLAKMSAENYVAAADRIAAAITTALVVVAAVVTTVLTAGAAASIWIPVLVTAGAGLVGMGLSAAIKGGRYSRDEIARDFAMTVITAATAGIGAAAGTALRGGMPALRAAAGSMRVSQAAMRTALLTAGRTTAMRASLTLFEEMAIGGVTNGLNGMGSAMADPAVRRSEDPTGAVLNAGFRSFLGGVTTAGIMRPFARFAHSDSPATRAIGRGVGQGLSGAGGRTVEIAYDRQRGADRRSIDEITTEIASTGIISGFQGFAESRLEDRARARVERREAAAARAARGGEREERPRPPPRGAAAAEEGAAPLRPVPRITEADAAAATRPHLPGEERPARPVPASARAEPPEPAARPRPMPRAGGPEEEITQRIVRPVVADEEPTLRLPRPVATDEEPTQRIIRPRAAGEEPEPPTQRRPRAAPSEEKPEPPTRRRAPAGPEEPEHATRPRLVADEPEEIQLGVGDAMMPPDPRSRAEALEMFRNNVQGDPNRECAVYVNSVTGEHVIIQGSETRVFVDRDAAGKPVGVLGEGNPQRWKQILDGGDRGEWLLVAHNHPGEADATAAGWATRLPSGRGGDFDVMAHESAMLGGRMRHSQIEVTHQGRTSITEFAYDPESPRPFALIYDDPTTGQRVFRRFASLEGYGEFYQNLTGVTPHIDAPGAPATQHLPTPIEMLHGTHSTAAADIRARGIQLAAIAHDHQDFGRAFYLTLDEPNAIRYATDAAAGQRARVRGDTPEVLRFTFRLEDLGDVVDVRPGGAHREAWEKFLALPAGHPDLGGVVPALPGARLPWTDARSYIMGLGIQQRGLVFEQFLNHIGMAHAPVVRGDLGGLGTSGRVAAYGEQIAIRTQEAADRLGAALRAAAGGVPEPPPPVPASAARRPPPPAPEEAATPVRPARADEPEPTPAARRPPPGAEPPARTRARNVEELFAEIEGELAHAAARPEPGTAPTRTPAPPAEVAPLPQPLLERLHSGAREVADAALAGIRAARGGGAARELEELILLAPGVMIGQPDSDIPATARGPRWRVGLLDANSETVRDRRLAELPEALARPLVLTEEARARLGALLRTRRAAARPGETARQRNAQVEATIARWERRGMTRREIGAYEGQVRRLETYTHGEEGFGTARRARMQAEEDALRGQVDSRMKNARNVRERGLLRRIMQRTGEGWLAAFGRTSMPQRGTKGWDLVEQWHRYLDSVEANNRANPKARQTPDQEGFERYMRRYMKGTQRPRLSELAAAEGVSQRAGAVLRQGPGDPPPPGLEMLKIALDIDPVTRASRNEPSEPGTDWLGLRPGDGVLVYGDDKAHQATRRNRGAIEDVEAFVPGLARNMRDDAAMLETRFRALQDEGLAVEARHAAVPDRLRACARELEQAFPRGMSLRGRRAQARFRNILRKHGVELVITAAAIERGVDRVAPRLARAGIRFLTPVPPSMLDADEADDLPLIPVPPSP